MLTYRKLVEIPAGDAPDSITYKRTFLSSRCCFSLIDYLPQAFKPPPPPFPSYFPITCRKAVPTGPSALTLQERNRFKESGKVGDLSKREHSGCARNTFEIMNAAGVASGESAVCKYVIYVRINFRPSQFYSRIEILHEHRSPSACPRDAASTCSPG